MSRKQVPLATHPVAIQGAVPLLAAAWQHRTSAGDLWPAGNCSNASGCTISPAPLISRLVRGQPHPVNACKPPAESRFACGGHAAAAALALELSAPRTQPTTGATMKVLHQGFFSSGASSPGSEASTHARLDRDQRPAPASVPGAVPSEKVLLSSPASATPTEMPMGEALKRDVPTWLRTGDTEMSVGATIAPCAAARRGVSTERRQQQVNSS